MLRILANIFVSGSKKSIEEIAATGAIPFGEMRQLGLKRKPPSSDDWSYASPWFRFDPERLDQTLRAFVEAHRELGQVLQSRRDDVQFAFLTVCPVGENGEETFAAIFSKETLLAIWNQGLDLEVSPASVMPEVGFWSPC